MSLRKGSPALSVAFAFAMAWGLLGCEGKASPTETTKPPSDGATRLPDAPTYFHDIEPILQLKCGGCHVQGGAAPFPLTSYDEASTFGPAIQRAVVDKQMPPWPPSREGKPLLFDRSLTDDEIATINDWAKAGFPLGSPADHQKRSPEMPTLRDDFIVKMPSWEQAADSAPRMGDHESYRCFLLGSTVPRDSFVTAYEFRPGNPAIVHHAVLYALSAQKAAGVLARLHSLEGQDGMPGFDCPVGPPLAPSEEDWLRFVASWKPGQGPTPLPSGVGIPVTHDDQLVLEMHYHALGPGSRDQTQIAFQLESDGVQPVEDRPLANKDFTVPAGEKNGRVAAELPIDSDTTLVSAFPHMHLLGKSISLLLERADGNDEMLISIPQWQFGWQGSYSFANPVPLHAGDRLQLRCNYDNSAEHQPYVNGVRQKPHELHWGGSSLDEMCIAHMFFTATGGVDRK